MTVERKKSQVNPVNLDSKRQFSLLCRNISLDASAEHLATLHVTKVMLTISRDSMVTVVHVFFKEFKGDRFILLNKS